MIWCVLQDILGNDSIKLDWTFRYSLINDIVKVCRLVVITKTNSTD